MSWTKQLAKLNSFLPIWSLINILENQSESHFVIQPWTAMICWSIWFFPWNLKHTSADDPICLLKVSETNWVEYSNSLFDVYYAP